MTALAILQDDGAWKHLLWHCAGCGIMHAVPVVGLSGPVWHWNGSLDAPTLAPSVMNKGRLGVTCHIFMRAGVVEFLSDCSHDKAGQSLQLLPHGEWP